MSTAIYIIYIVAHGFIFGRALRLRPQSHLPVWALFIIAEVGLIYDNMIIALGRLLGAGDLLHTLNLHRFLIHAIITPTLILVGFNLLKRSGAQWAAGRAVQTVACLITTGLMTLGLISYRALQLEATAEFGILRYHDISGQGPPIPAIITIVLLIIFGVMIWRNVKWPWLCLAAVAMFISAAVPMSLVGPIVGSGGEVILALGILVTEAQLQKVGSQPLTISMEPSI
ncbi:MAG: hypothetical protein KDE51_03105 [Anaerolineales bacterium]|nr:hypothetical protein [Anaerolineales bacterium]